MTRAPRNLTATERVRLLKDLKWLDDEPFHALLQEAVVGGDMDFCRWWMVNAEPGKLHDRFEAVREALRGHQFFADIDAIKLSYYKIQNALPANYRRHKHRTIRRRRLRT
jgi:hypothetical protein